MDRIKKRSSRSSSLTFSPNSQTKSKKNLQKTWMNLWTLLTLPCYHRTEMASAFSATEYHLHIKHFNVDVARYNTQLRLGAPTQKKYSKIFWYILKFCKIFIVESGCAWCFIEFCVTGSRTQKVGERVF